MAASDTPAKVTITVAVATCGRPEGLRATLQTLAAQEGLSATGLHVRVAVVDNHARATAKPLVAALAATYPLPLSYAAEPQPGISFARNRLVKMAQGSDYIAFIDDDEQAEPGWLAELARVAAESGASAVLGPVISEMSDDARLWMAPLYDRPRHADGARATLSDFRTSNVLLSMAALANIAGPFDPAFALIGGSDTMLGMHMETRGEHFAWADRAVVREVVPRERATPSWYLKRRFRSGHVYTKALYRSQGPAQAAQLSLRRAVGSLGLGTLAVARALTQTKLERLQALGLVVYGLGCAVGPFSTGAGEYYGRATS